MATTTKTSEPVKIEKGAHGKVESSSLWRDTFRGLFRQRNAILGMILLGFLIIVAVFAPLIANYDPNQPMFGLPGESGRLPGKPPCVHLLGCPAEQAQHFMGLDLSGRDVFSRVVYGSRASLVVGISSVVFAIVIGSTLGMISGYGGGWIDNVIMRCMDVLLAFPSLLLAIAIVTVLGPSLINALLAIAVVSVPVYARLARASVLAVKEYEYITANRSLGATPVRILFVHIFPNSLTPLIVQGTLDFGGAVLTAAALSFLGLGQQPPWPEWGAMVSSGATAIFTAPHIVFYPGLAIMFTVLGFNLLGDGMRDALDPRLNRS